MEQVPKILKASRVPADDVFPWDVVAPGADARGDARNVRSWRAKKHERQVDPPPALFRPIGQPDLKKPESVVSSALLDAGASFAFIRRTAIRPASTAALVTSPGRGCGRYRRRSRRAAADRSRREPGGAMVDLPDPLGPR